MVVAPLELRLGDLLAGLQARLYRNAARSVAQHGLLIHTGLVLIDVAHGRLSPFIVFSAIHFAVTLKGASGAPGRSGSQHFVIDSSLREESQD
jgi:hypothetical protein